jgi:diaminopimelate epimerase
MKIEFTKMQGCGNDYVYINGFTQKIDPEKKKDFVIRVSDRHFGIGSDGVIFINPSDKADFEMEMYNADGTRAEMCGNGIRCVAKYVYDHEMTDREDITIESFGKIKPIQITSEDGKAVLIRVDMDEPELRAGYIPVSSQKLGKPDGSDISGDDFDKTGNPAAPEEALISENDRIVDVPITADGNEYRITCVSMGNPHAVIFLDPEGLDIEAVGPGLEHHPVFPNRANIEFVRVDDRSNVHMRVWERGTGETLACGTGCCATAVACMLNGLTDRKVTVHVLGGDITVEWDEKDNHVYMTGPATTVYDGVIEA